VWCVAGVLQVSLWDVRGAGRGARVAKLSPGPQHGHFYCLAASDDGGLPLIGGLPVYCVASLMSLCPQQAPTATAKLQHSSRGLWWWVLVS
jgi:hypothetical protein